MAYDPGSQETRTVSVERPAARGLSIGEAVITAGLLLGLVAMFLDWSVVSCRFGCPGLLGIRSRNGFHDWGALYYFTWLATTAYLVIRTLAAVSLPALWARLEDWVLYLAAGLLMLSALLFYYFGIPQGTRGGVHFGIGYGWTLALFAAGLVVAGAVLKQSRVRLTSVQLVRDGWTADQGLRSQP